MSSGVGAGHASDADVSNRPWLSVLVAVSLVFAGGCAASDGSDESDDEETETLDGEESSADALSASSYPAPNLSAAEKAQVFATYDVDPNGVVPRSLLVDAVAFYDFHKAKLRNREFLTVTDFSKHSGNRRFFVVNMTSGAVSSYVVAHGSGSDPGRTGLPTRFSNTKNSNQSSVGYYVTGETYNGKHGYSLRLDGVSSTNSNTRSRGIVIHGASYVSDGRAKQGTSWGCFALPTSQKDGVIGKLKGGSLLYAARN